MKLLTYFNEVILVAENKSRGVFDINPNMRGFGRFSEFCDCDAYAVAGDFGGKSL